MTNTQMIAAVLNSIQTDANLMTLLRLMVANNIVNVNTAQLQAMCNALGIVTT